MATEFNQAELDETLSGNTPKQLRMNFESKGFAVSDFDKKSKYVKYLEDHCIELRASMLKNLFRTFKSMEQMAGELEVDL